MGKAALDGLEGVRQVTSGFRGYREISTVVYDPQTITVQEMVDALKRAGTYRGTVGE